MKTREFTSQMISPPIVLNLSMQEAELLNTYMDQLQGLDSRFEEFGQDSMPSAPYQITVQYCKEMNC